jgi:uncharacterized protein
MPPPKKALLVFMRYPEPGRVKSRLASAIGSGPAAQIYDKLLRRTLGVAVDFKWRRAAIDIFVFFTPAEKYVEIRETYPGPWTFLCQQGQHLGERMEEAVRKVLHRGYSQVVLAGTDLADLEFSDFDEAFQAMDDGYSALGPAADGGFYIIGVNRPCPLVFQSDVWSTGEIFARTERLLEQTGTRVKRLRERRDIDNPEDLETLDESPEFCTNLSVIIPTLNSIERLKPLLQKLERQLWPDDEIIVVQAEGGAPPAEPCETIQVAPRTPGVCPRTGLLPFFSDNVLAVASPRGRGLQLNRGAGAAKGGLLFFLHDDSIPPPNFACSVRKLCRLPEVALGCFRLTFSPSTPALDWIARWANRRTQSFGLPYGDQGLFCRREVYDNVGGFKQQYLMEDVDFVRNCRPRGRILMLPDSISTSPERYLRQGILRASLRNHITMLLYHLGVSDRRLYAYYYGNPKRHELLR